MPTGIDLLISAFAKFLDAGFGTDMAKYGLFGFCFEPVALSTTSHIERASASAAIWQQKMGELPNPYKDVLAFFEEGGQLGRWENNILDVFLASGERFGVPLQTLVQLASNYSLKWTDQSLRD